MTARTRDNATNEALGSYKGSYLAFFRAIRQTQLLAGVAEYSFRFFPKNLPRPLAVAVGELFKQVGSALDAVISSSGTGGCGPDRNGNLELAETSGRKHVALRTNSKAITVATAFQPRNGNLELAETSGRKHVVLPRTNRKATTVAIDAFQLMTALELTKKRVSLLNVGKQFQALARRQAVAMMFAHTDAFMADSLRVVCRVRPEVLRSSKQLAWETALSFPTIDALRAELVEEFAYEFGWKTLGKRLDFFRDRLGINFDIPADNLKLLNVFEQRRHLIIHNGGVVTKRYTQETGEAKSKVGKPIVVSRSDLRSLGDTVSLIGSELFFAIAQKYLAAKPSDLTKVWRGRAREE